MVDFDLAGCRDLDLFTAEASKKTREVNAQQYSNIDFNTKVPLFQRPLISFDIPQNKKPVASPRVIRKDPVGDSLPILESSLPSEDN